MFPSQSSDHHQGSITVVVQLLLIGVPASSYSSMWLYVVCVYDVPVRVVSGYVLYITRHHTCLTLGLYGSVRPGRMCLGRC